MYLIESLRNAKRLRKAYAYKKAHLKLAARVIDALGFLWNRPARTFAQEFGRILVIRLDQLGDVVQALPSIDALTESFPQSRVDMLTTPIGAELLRARGFAGKIHTWNCDWFDRKRRPNFSVRDMRSLLAAEKYDLACDLRGDVRLIALLRAARVKIISGYGATGGGFLLDVDPGWDSDQHAVDRDLKVVEAIGARAVSREPHLVPEIEIDSQPPLRRRLAIHPDAGTSAKRWPLESFVTLIDRLLGTGHFDVTLIGLDSELGLAIEKQLRVPITNLMGKTSLPQLINTLAKSEGLLTNDSGPAHIASALGKPVWVLWSGTASSAEWRPRGGPVELFEHAVPCAPCGLALCPVPGHPCMTNISVDTVSAALTAWGGALASRS